MVALACRQGVFMLNVVLILVVVVGMVIHEMYDRIKNAPRR